MYDWMMDGWGMGLGFVFWVALLVLIVAAVLVRALTNHDQRRYRAALW